MLTSGIIDLAIGLTFVFGVTAALASVVTELIARLIGLRGAYLLSGLRELVDGGTAVTDLRNAKTDYDNIQGMIKNSAVPSAPPPSAAAALLGGPILGNQGIAGQFTSRNLWLGASRRTGRLPKMTAYVTASKVVTTDKAGPPGTATVGTPEKAEQKVGRVKLWRQRRSLPSYFSGKSFAEAVIDLVVPDSHGQTTMTTIQHNIEALTPKTMMPFRTSLEALVKDAGDDIGRFRTSLEKWYDDHMDRVSGWYKRYVAIITLAFGTILIVLLNLNALTIGRTLYTQSTVSTAISNVAAKGANCLTATSTPVPVPVPSSQSPQECLEDLQAQLSAAATAGLPIGWGTVRDCTVPGAHCNWLDQRGILSRHGDSLWQLVLVVIGFLIMIITIVPGAQFWFGLLSKLGTLRATGPKPTATPS